MLLSFGQTVAAERELRQARNDGAPEEIALPPLLQAMLIRKETKELLAEFPDPPQGTQDKAAPDILKARAVAFQVLGQTKDANAAIDRALGLRRDLQMLVMRATLAREQNDLALALRLADEVSLLAPTSQEAAVLKISLFHQSGQLDKVLATADEFVRRNPQSLTGKLMRAEALIELHQDAKAKEEIEAALKQAPNSLLGNYYLAILRARAQDFKGAWAIAQSLSPDFVQSEPDFAMMVSYIAQANGQLESAGGVLTALISRHPEVTRARLQLAGVRLSQQDPLAALAALEPLKTLDDPYTQALLAHTYMLLHRYNEAITFLEKTLSSGRDDRLLKGELAVSQLEVGNMDEATKGFRELVERNPGNPELAAPLIGVLMRTGKLDEALKIADGMAKAKPQSALPAFFRGEILAAKGNLADAVTAFDQSLAADPKYIPALYYRANVSALRGNSEDANKDLQKILILDPGNVRAYITKAQIAQNNDQDSQAIALIVSAIKTLPKEPALRLALANYQMSHGKFQDALATLNGLLQVSPNNTDALAMRGQVQILSGAKKDGVDTLRSLVATDPSSPAARSIH
jgi:putative PEP-CTERM system TPR-repeat lipoprotein